MVDDLAPGVYTACARAWVYTLQIRTCSISWTIRVRGTLGSTGRVGVTKVTLDAGAACLSPPIPTLSIGSTGTWLAGVHRARVHGLDDFRNLVALSKGVALVSQRTLADGKMVPN